MKALRNSWFCLKTVFRYAPWNALLSNLGFGIPAFFQGLQVLLTQYIVDSAVAYAKGTGPLEPLVHWGVLLVVVLILWVTLQRIGVYQNAVIAVKLKEKMAPEIARRLTGLEFSAFEDPKIHEVFQKMSSEPDVAVSQCFNRTIITFHATVSLIFSLAVFFSISVWIGLGVVLIGIPMAVLCYYSARRKVVVTEESADAKRRMADLMGLITNKHAMFEMKLFGAEKLFTGKWNFYGKKWADITAREYRKFLLVNLGSKLLNVVYLIFIVSTVAVGFINGSLTLGQLTAALNGAAGVGNKLDGCSRQVVYFLEQAMGINFYMKFMELDTRKDVGGVNSLSHYDIAFENVSFRYPGTERDILKNVTFYVKDGERIAFVGENGAGKSTVIKLLCGLYEPTTGNVTLGGVPVRELTPEFRSECLSVVFQDFQAYQMTLRENVALGNLGALKKDAKLLKALEQADAAALATSAENGLNRNLGKLEEDGQDLSKGQWQRVAMARAFVSDAKYVVLDEPTASLDPLAESHMYENFARIFRERGTIMISHRLASAKMADRILVLDGGRIVQSGSHEELMEREGLYKTMFLAQSSFYQDQEDAVV